MSSSLRQYIGVTGFASPAELETVQREFGPEGPMLMAGVLSDSNLLKIDGVAITDRCPPLVRLRDIFSALDPVRAIGLVHFYTSELGLLIVQTKKILQLANLRDSPVRGRFHGFQYNGDWPVPNVLWGALDDCRALMNINRDESWAAHNVLVIGPQALAERPSTLAARLHKYFREDRADGFPFGYVLIDMSAGKGKELEWARTEEILTALVPFTESPYSLKLAVAGGLAADNVHLLKSLLDIYPELSIDAEGRLRDELGLDLDATLTYVEEALKVLTSV